MLRDGRADADVAFAEDDRPGAFHLAAAVDGAIAGVATFFPTSADRSEWQLRGMAVLPQWQGHGVGRALVAEAVDRLRERGATLLWANVRDSAAAFYQRLGWEIVGDQFLTATGLPHHVGRFPLTLESP